jgi:hypothetical protein
MLATTVITKDYLSKGPLGKKRLRHLLVQNLTPILRYFGTSNQRTWEYYFHDFEPELWVSNFPPQSCNTVAKINLTCPSDTSGTAAKTKHQRSECTRLPKTHFLLWGGQKPRTVKLTVSVPPLGRWLQMVKHCAKSQIYPCLSSQVLERLPHRCCSEWQAKTATELFEAQGYGQSTNKNAADNLYKGTPTAGGWVPRHKEGYTSPEPWWALLGPVGGVQHCTRPPDQETNQVVNVATRTEGSGQAPQWIVWSHWWIGDNCRIHLRYHSGRCLGYDHFSFIPILCQQIFWPLFGNDCALVSLSSIWTCVHIRVWFCWQCCLGSAAV